LQGVLRIDQLPERGKASLFIAMDKAAMSFSQVCDAFFAHSTEREDRSDWQPLAEHLLQTATLAAVFGDSFGAATLADLSGRLHDLGKYTREFQLRIAGAHARVDHSTWGAKVAIERYGPLGHLLAYGIAGHHAGLADGREGVKRTALSDRIDAALPELLDRWMAEVPLPAPSILGLPEAFRVKRGHEQFQQSMLARMVFSCLVDADFIDTERFYQRIAGIEDARSLPVPSLEDLRAQLDTHLAGFRADTEVNGLRKQILSAVRTKAIQAPGLFTLTVPTGGGKTLASMAFALDHAIEHGLDRVIYVIPFTSIVEQTAAVFRQAFGLLGERSVLEHHSTFDPPEIPRDDPDRFQAARKLTLAVENWDVPVVVTTAVQFLESLFSDRPSVARKLHRIARSVVVLDEAQTLPLKLLRPSVAAIDELVRNYRSSVVLCTATQPALGETDGLKGGLPASTELAPDPAELHRNLVRTRVRHVGILSDHQVREQLLERQQVLCIVNNRRHARALYDSMCAEKGARHLTTLMCAAHRRQVLAGVRRDLKAGEPCRVVSTSLVEAGVDVDFPMVMRAEAGLDSIAQAAGRCNREGRRPLEESEVWVFAVDNPDWAPPPELREFAQVARSVLRRHAQDPMAPGAIRAYFQELFWQRGPDELDAHGLLDLLKSSQLQSLPFETIARHFRVIESGMQPVLIPFDDAARALINSLPGAPVGLTARRLQSYLVQVPPKAMDALRNCEAIRPVAPERFGDQFMALARPELYDQNTGLRWDDAAFIRAESLCW